MSNISVDYDVLNQRGSPAWFTDTFANIPTAGFVGRMFISKDTFAFYRDTGTGWDLIGGPGIGTLTGSGVVGQVSFFNGTQVLAGNNNLFWDNTNSRLGINTTTPGAPLDIHGTGTQLQLNGTGSNNAYLVFQNAGTSKWRIGNTFSSPNSFDIYNNATTTNALSISSSNILSFIGVSNFDEVIRFKQGLSTISTTSGYTTMYSTQGGGAYGFGFYNGGGVVNFIDFPTSSSYLYTFPSATGTIALTSNIPSVSGTTNYISKFTATTTLGNSLIYDNGTNVLIGSTTSNFGVLDITTSNAVGFTSALGIGFTTNVAEGDSVGISFKTKISIGGGIYENARISTITDQVTLSAYGSLAFYTMNATVLAEKMRISSNGNVGINTITPNAVLDIAINGSTQNYPRIYDSRTQAINQGGKLSLGGYSDSLTTITSFGQIVGAKTNATSGNTSGYLSLLTNNGSGLVEALRLSSTQEATFAQSVTAAAFTIPSGGLAGSRNILSGENTNTGTTGKIRIFLQNSTSNFFIEKYGTGYTSSGIATTAGAAVYDDGAGGLSVGATSGSGTLRLFSGNAEAIRIATNGNVLINTTTDNGYKLNVNGQPGANGYTLWTNYSDFRFKENITNFDSINVLEKISQIRPVTYNYNELSGFDEETRNRRISGFIAQELKQVFPDMVGTIIKNNVEYYDTNLSNLDLYLVKAIQEIYQKLIRNNIN